MDNLLDLRLFSVDSTPYLTPTTTTSFEMTNIIINFIRKDIFCLCWGLLCSTTCLFQNEKYTVLHFTCLSWQNKVNQMFITMEFMRSVGLAFAWSYNDIFIYCCYLYMVDIARFIVYTLYGKHNTDFMR